MKTILNLTAIILALQIIIITLAITNTSPKGYKILIANLPQYGITEIPNQCYLN